jgi:hypothetical protein
MELIKAYRLIPGLVIFLKLDFGLNLIQGIGGLGILIEIWEVNGGTVVIVLIVVKVE